MRTFRKEGVLLCPCCFCQQHAETSQHIFFECKVTSRLWEWLCKGSDMILDCSSCITLLLGPVGRGSQLAQHGLNSAIIHTIWLIWTERNQRCFHDKKKTMPSLFNCMLSEVRLSYQLVLAKGNFTMHDYKISRLFNIPLQTKRVDIRQKVH